MQAIQLLHNQLSIVTEKLEHANTELIAQRNEIKELEEEGRFKESDIADLTDMLQKIEAEEENLEERLSLLQIQTISYELEHEKQNGALEVMPFAFHRLSDDFVSESKIKSVKVETLLSTAINENFWKSKITRF